MTRIRMVAFVALIAMSLCSVAYAQTVTVSPTVGPTVSPTVYTPKYGGYYLVNDIPSSSGYPFSQFINSARGNADVILGYGKGIPSYVGGLTGYPSSQIHNSARGNENLAFPSSAGGYTRPSLYGYYNSARNYAYPPEIPSSYPSESFIDPPDIDYVRGNSARGNADAIAFPAYAAQLAAAQAAARAAGGV